MDSLAASKSSFHAVSSSGSPGNGFAGVAGGVAFDARALRASSPSGAYACRACRISIADAM